MSEEITLTDANFDQEVMQSAVPVLVDFWAEWCTPCRMIAPSLEALAGEYKGKVKIGKLNVDKAADTANRFGIVSIPTLIVFKGGQILTKKVGAGTKQELEQLISKAL